MTKSLAVLLLVFFGQIFFLACSANAGIFGPANYDECVNDGKVGRTPAELRNLYEFCASRFPKLPKILRKGRSDVNCFFDDGRGGAEPLSLTFDGDKVWGKRKIDYDLILRRANNEIYLAGSKVIKVKGPKGNLMFVAFYLDPRFGSARLELFESEFAKKIDQFSLSCEEKK